MFRRHHDAGYFEWTRAALAVALVVLLIAYQLWPRSVKLDTPVLGLIALLVVLVALPLVEELTLPGGVSAKMRQQLRDAERSVTKLQDETSVPASRTIDGAAESMALPDYLASLAAQQPAASLMALRAELEDRLRETYSEFYDERPPHSSLEILRRLLRDDRIDTDQADLVLRLLEIGNQAAHARDVRPEEAEQAVAYGQTLLSSISRRTAESPRDFEDQVARELQSIPSARIDRRVRITSHLLDQPLEADFIVSTSNGRCVVEARFVRTLRSLESSITAARLVAYAALREGAADRAVIVVPDELGVQLEDLGSHITLSPLATLPVALAREPAHTVS
jgi:hypothetical protein